MIRGEEMTDEDMMEPESGAAAVMHDLRRFLHDARDQQDALDRAVTAISGSASLMRGHEAELQKIHRAIKRQIDQGVQVQVDGALEAHAKIVTNGTSGMKRLFDDALARWQRQKFEVVTLALISSLLGGAAGVIATAHLLGRM